MKIRLILFVTIFFQSFLIAQDHAHELLNKDYLIAQKEDKNVFVIFHASWCGWCKKLDKEMNADSCKELFSKSYIVEHLVVKESPDKKNLENPGALELLKQYKGEKSGIPFFLIFDSNGNVLDDSFDSNGQNLGCPTTKEEVGEFISILKNTSKLNEKELETIFNQFYKKD